MSEPKRWLWPIGVNPKYVVLASDYDALRDEVARLRGVIVWALGYTDFRAREEGDPPYWWRTELVLRAKLTGEQIDEVLSALTPQAGKGGAEHDGLATTPFAMHLPSILGN